MDDIQFAFSVSDKLGQLYRNAKTFSGQAPALSLTHLRGLAYEVCDMLDRGTSPTEQLANRIKSLESTGILKAAAIRRLRILQRHGNIAAHPEEYDHEDHDFGAMANESLAAARELLEQLLVLRTDPVPTYYIATLEDSGLRDMCFQAMVLGDIDAIHQVGEYFKAWAVQLSVAKSGVFTADGYSFDARGQIEQAMFWFKKGADLSHPDCMYQLGYYHAQTKGIDSNLRAQGERLISRASEAGHVDATFYVAEMLLDGMGIFEKDLKGAQELLEQAAQQNHPGALAKLGGLYALGIGCEVDYQKAANCTIRAAEAGYPQGQYNLFVLYHDGKGIEKNKAEAIRWLIEAANQDFPSAIYNLACFTQSGYAPGRMRADALEGYRRCLAFTEYRARAALAIAEMSLNDEDSMDGWLESATHAQACFEIITRDGDPHVLLGDCLATAKKAVDKVRIHIRRHGTERHRLGQELLVCLLFDYNGQPVTNREKRIEEFAELLLQCNGSNAEASRRAFSVVLAAAGIEPNAPAPLPLRMPAKAVRVLPSFPLAGRNDPCPCGSGKKYKKCHGA